MSEQGGNSAEIEKIRERAEMLLRRFYGYSTFRPMQLDIITSAILGEDSVVLMPTGGGKSLCYQIPALFDTGGVTIVISPLIALMKDQVMALIANGIPAAAVNSMQSDAENREIMERLYKGRIKLLYISPERLLADIEYWSSDIPVSLIAVDEAHCISQWGHDFRPAYTGLRRLKEFFPKVPVMALTATADRLTRDDISAQLALRSPRTFIGSFDRPNLSLKVVSDPGKNRRLGIIASLIDRYSHDSGIVYCLSRKQAESVNNELLKRGYRSAVYHAGLTVDERNRTQDSFVAGDLQAVCATVAFGMGIDKSNIRWVVHNNMPRNIESYYQEIGRAGRDGVKAETIMFYSYSDVIALQSFADDSGMREVNSEKLRRMQAYAESSLCRRRVLLSYFNETMTCDCGNCDVCLNPPERIDGTVIAQKALSAICRTGEKAGFSMIIDVLRGVARKDLADRGFNMIKTYGVGRDLSFSEWNSYLSQLIQLGLIDIAYEDSRHLRVTAYGHRVLRGETRVTLSKYIEPAGRKNSRRKTEAAESAKLSSSEILLIDLKEVRLKLAQKENIAPHMVLSDKTLLEMSDSRPKSMKDFSTLEGVGEIKAVKYWKPFVSAVRKHEGLKVRLKESLSKDESLLLLEAGHSVEAISQIKGIQPKTVYGHVSELIGEDKFSDFAKIITKEQYLRVMELSQKFPDTFYEILSKEMPLGLPRVALSISDYLLRHGSSSK